MVHRICSLKNRLNYGKKKNFLMLYFPYSFFYIIFRLPHSASNNGENWSFALKSGTGKQWEQISLDENTSSVVTDKFVSVKINHF